MANENEVAVVLDQESAQRVIANLENALVKQAGLMKLFVEGKFDEAKRMIEDGLEDSEAKREDLMNMYQVLFTAFDQSDLSEDEQLDLKSVMKSILARVSSNETLISTNLGKISSIETAINKEIQDRAAQGQSLRSVIDGVREGLQAQVTTIKAQLQAVSVKVDGLTEWATEITSGVPVMVSRALTTIQANLGLTDDQVAGTSGSA